MPSNLRYGDDMSSNMMLAWPNRIDSAALDGGLWVESMPLARLQNRTLGMRARSVDTLQSSTQFRATLGTDFGIRVIGLAHHNFSVLAKYRIRGARDNTFTDVKYDSGWLYVFEGQGPWGAPDTWLEWSDDRFWMGGPIASEIDGYRQTLIHVLPQRTNALCWKIEIDDFGNPEGFLEIGRAFFADAWQPILNVVLGAELTWNSRTTVEEAASGAEYFDIRQPYRTFRGTLEYLDRDNGLMQMQEMQRRLDVWGEVMFILDPTNKAYRRQQSFLARLRELSPLEYPYVNAHRMAVELKEIL